MKGLRSRPSCPPPPAGRQPSQRGAPSQVKRDQGPRSPTAAPAPLLTPTGYSHQVTRPFAQCAAGPAPRPSLDSNPASQ